MKRTMAPVFCLLFLGYALSASADISNIGLNFTAPSQSMWGAGGPSAGFHAADSIGGSVGVYYDIGASTGTAEGLFGGNLSVNHVANMAAPGLTSATVNFTGASGGYIRSDLGVWAKIGAYVHKDLGIFEIDTTFDIINKDYALNVYEDFTPQLGATVSGHDAAAVYGLGKSYFGVGATLTFDITQTDTFKPTDITGQLKYQLAGTADYGIADFTIGPGGEAIINANLSKSGTWNFSLMNLELDNQFQIAFGLGMTPTIDYGFGSWSRSISVDLYHRDPFELDFTELSFMDAFSIVVGGGDPGNGTQVPEPSAMLFLGLCLVASAMVKKLVK